VTDVEVKGFTPSFQIESAKIQKGQLRP